MTETRQFAAETARVLNLMIHALYTNRDIFLRELISNASDACDKLRYAAQQDGALLKDHPQLEITLAFDEKAKTVTITDTGIGMNRDDLVAHLGTIAKSGTGEFFESIQDSGFGIQEKENSPNPESRIPNPDAAGINLIGQFGVGFYSAFMVADKVTVESRKAGEETRWKWESDGLGEYSIGEAGEGPRGTTITLHLKKDAKEYLDQHKLSHIVATYSDHISFPIRLTGSDGVVHTVNDGTAIWTRAKSEINDEQYQEFYRHVAHSPEKPWAVLHNKAEGALEYTSLLFIPGMKPFDLFHPERRRRVKLYVKRVFITDEGIDLVPPYLRFLRGVVDSADLPLNISRETLQKSKTLDKIRDAVANKVLAELKKRAKGEDYESFWTNFGAVLKEGLCEPNTPREKILDACKFYSTLSEGKLIGIADYVARMKEGQEAIYYLTGDSLAALEHSPQLEGFKKQGIEVLLLTDHVDDFWTNVTTSYQEKPFRSVIKAGADLEKFGGKKEAENEQDASNEATIDALIAAMKTLYGDGVRDVRTTRKLTDTPICLSVGEGDIDLRMERFLAEHKQLPMRAAKVVEINPHHALIQSLAQKAAHGALDADANDALWLLLDQALIAEGEPVTDAASFARRLGGLMQKGLAA